MTSISSSNAVASSSGSIPEQMRQKTSSRQRHAWEDSLPNLVSALLFHLSLRSNSITQDSLTSLNEDRVTPAVLLQERAKRLSDLVNKAVEPVSAYYAEVFSKMPKTLTVGPNCPKFAPHEDLSKEIQITRIILEGLSERLDEELEIQKGILNNTESELLVKAIPENIESLENTYQSLFDNYNTLAKRISDLTLYNKLFIKGSSTMQDLGVNASVTFEEDQTQQASKADEESYLPIPKLKSKSIELIHPSMFKSTFNAVVNLSDPSLSANFYTPKKLLKSEEFTDSLINNQSLKTLGLINKTSSAFSNSLNLAKVLSVKSKSKKNTTSRAEDRDLCLALHGCRNLPLAAKAVEKELHTTDEMFVVNLAMLADDFYPLDKPINLFSNDGLSYYNPYSD